VRLKGRKVYMVAGKEYPGELLHIKGMMLPGTEVGLSPLEYAQQSISLGLSAIEYGSDQFGQSLNMPGVIESPGKMLPEQMTAMAQAWRKARSKRGRGLPGVLEGGATWKPTGVTNEQAQFLQTRQWTAAEIAAQVFLVDPSDLGIPVGGTTLTYANLQERNLRRVQVTFLPWIIRIEAALSSLLPQPRYVKLNVNGLLRGDTSQRWSTYTAAMNINAIAAQVGQPPVMLTSEMREFEDLNVIDNDEPGAPADVPADTVEGTPVQMNASPVVVNVAPSEPRDTRNAVEPHIETHVHLSDVMSEPHVQVARAVEVLASQSEQLVSTVSDVLARVADMTEQIDDAVRSIPAPIVQLPEPVTTVRRIERDDNGRILRVIDEVS
jgi:Phage portal protein